LKIAKVDEEKNGNIQHMFTFFFSDGRMCVVIGSKGQIIDNGFSRISSNAFSTHSSIISLE
jgi:hypothetical protein